MKCLKADQDSQESKMSKTNTECKIPKRFFAGIDKRRINSYDLNRHDEWSKEEKIMKVKIYKEIRKFNKNLRMAMDDMDLKRIVSKMAQKAVHLEQLTLNLNMPEDGEGLTKLGQCIAKNLLNLKRLALGFTCSDEIFLMDIGELGYHIAKSLVNLEQLSLRFHFNMNGNIGDGDLEKLAYHVGKNLPALKQFSLKFENCSYITDRGLIALGFTICEKLTNLEGLSLHFIDCQEITDEGLQGFFTLNERLVKLKQLTLDFDRCSEISDESLIVLGHNIGNNLGNLEQLTLIITSTQNITCEGLRDLGYNISYLTNLKELTLNFRKKLVAPISKRLTKLEKFTLNYQRCGCITSEFLEDLAKMFQSLKVLRLDEDEAIFIA